MFRPSDARILLTLCVLCAAAFASPVAADTDEVADYLDRLQLRSLLTAHLEQQLGQATGEERDRLIDRLCDLYAELLEQATDADAQARLEERSRRLLEQVPSARADRLRLTLLIPKYTMAEKIAENHRLRMASDAEVESAKQIFADLAPKFSSLRQQIRQNAQGLERRVSRAAGSEATALNENAERTRGLYAQCTFLNAWSLYYQAWLANRPELARNAEPLFGEIINPENPNPQPEDVSVDLRALEPVARSILGMGLCKSLTASSATAQSWIALLTHENTFASIREQADVWRVAVHLQHREFQDVADIFAERAKAKTDIPTPWLRLVAVQALEDTHRARQADELAKFAVTQLASRGELEQVLDLARRYGVQALGDRGFAFRYVTGVVAYQQARIAHGNENPTLDAALATQYEEAAKILRQAVQENDADRFPEAAAACYRLIAWSLYFQSRFLDASAAFDEASAKQSGESAADALWMAIVSLDRIAEAGGSEAIAAQIDALTNRFVEAYPDHEQTPRLRMRRAVKTKKASPEAVAELQSIPPESEMYGTAQRTAAELLYQLFRGSANANRVQTANQFLAAAVPLIQSSALSEDVATPGETDRFISRCRQIMEVALADGIERVGPARAALEALNELQQNHNVDLTPFVDEIDCRRVQERLIAEDAATAAKIADELWTRDQSGIWARIAARSMFRYGHRVWKSQDADPAQLNSGIDLVIRYGGRVLHEFKDSASAVNQPGTFGYFAAVAEASTAKWEQTGDVERGKAALFLYQKLLASRPKNAAFLRAAALLEEKVGDRAKAVELWRAIVAGADQQASLWFEAKFNLIRMLAQSDPQRAREVMDQHKLLNPNYGPEPWAARLKGLDQSIGKPVSASPNEPAVEGSSDDPTER
jgi:hypothetical protein